MSRVSDTRQRTRQAAAKLVADGRRPHELTVDLVYAEIRQGSRTTINDELKLWKDEQAKVDALSAALPAPVANAMLAAWAVAVEHGERVFDERRMEVEAELTQAITGAEATKAVHTEAIAEIAALRELVERARGEAITARADAQRERDAKDAALQRAADSDSRLVAEHSESQSRLDKQRETHELQLNQQREALATSEARLRDELARATDRLEGVQKHVLLQVAEAREVQRRAEDQLAKALHRNERLSGDAELLRAEAASLTSQLQRSAQECASATATAARLQAERDDLTIRLATTNGRLEAATQQLAELMARVTSRPRRGDGGRASRSADDGRLGRPLRPDDPGSGGNS
jgi:chromosome segregation ATPase